MKFLAGTAQLVACGIALCTVLATNVQAEPGSAKVQAIKAGSAQYSEDGVAFNPLQVGAVLQEGATIKTDSLGVVDLNLGKNGPWLRLTPATTLALTMLGVDKGAGETIIDTELGLSTGCVLGEVKKMSASSRYEVKTPVGSAQIHAGKYQLCATGRLIVEEGEANFNFAPAGATSATPYKVPAEYMFDPTLNSGRGGVVPTPMSTRELVQSEFGSKSGGMLAQNRVQTWAPSPGWMQPNRPFDEPSLNRDAIANPWVNPPVLQPVPELYIPEEEEPEPEPPISPVRPRR